MICLLTRPNINEKSLSMSPFGLPLVLYRSDSGHFRIICMAAASAVIVLSETIVSGTSSCSEILQ